MKKTGSFLTIFHRKGKEGSGPSQKKSLSEKTEVVKKGGGSPSQFFY